MEGGLSELPFEVQEGLELWAGSLRSLVENGCGGHSMNRKPVRTELPLYPGNEGSEIGRQE